MFVQSEQFRLPGGKGVQAAELNIEIVLADAAEQLIERPEKTTAMLQRRKEAAHKKTQKVEGMAVRTILAAAFSGGAVHDFRLFKESGLKLLPHVMLIADLGCQGAAKIHISSRNPAKKLCPLKTKNSKSPTGPCPYSAFCLSMSSVRSKYSEC